MKGWVYIITNKSMPNLLNIGFSNNDPALKVEELNNSEIPHPYVVEYDALLNEPKETAQKIQAILSYCHENKGWFRCEVAKAIIAIRQAAAGSIIVENNRNAEVKKPEIRKAEPEPEKVAAKSLDIQDLYAAVIGDKNTDYYLAKFAEFDQQKPGLKPSWNWSAFLFNNGWTLYRKMYGWFFTFWGIAVFLNMFEKGSSLSHSVAVETIVYTYTFFITLIIAIFFGFFADSLYYKKVKKKIAAAQQTIKNEAKLFEFLQSQGGVHNWVMWLFSGLAVSGILASIIIPVMYPAQKVNAPPPTVATTEPPPVRAETTAENPIGNCISGDCTNGQGTFFYQDGAVSTGNWKEGKQEGLGTYTSAKGDKYVGEFKNNELEQGTLTAPDGEIRYGKYTSDGGLLMLQGQGTVNYANGNKYVGEFKNDLREGQGTMFYSDGGKYVGQWKNAKKEGQGTYIYTNGAKYVGEYKDGKYNGQGTYTFSNGTVMSGIWKDDKFLQ